VSSERGDEVLLGDERELLVELDRRLARLAPGVLVTWNGTFFDLPFIAARAAALGLQLGLRCDAAGAWPPPYRPGPHESSWWGHRHLDGYRLYRDDLGRALGLSCALKSLSRLCGLQPVEVDRSRMHLLDDASMREYVASDARLARQLVQRRMPLAYRSVDPPPGSSPRASVRAQPADSPLR
jgi:hypothetical protein